MHEAALERRGALHSCLASRGSAGETRNKFTQSFEQAWWWERRRRHHLPRIDNLDSIGVMFKRRSLDVYSAQPLSKPSKIDGYQHARLNADQFARAEFCRPRLDLFRKRLADGFAAHGLLTNDGELAYYMWLSIGDENGWAPWALGSCIQLPKTSGYIFDCKTAPDHRNKGLYSTALKHARWLCHESECEKVLIDVEPLNEPAVRAIKKAGFKKLASTEVAKFGPIIRMTNGSKSSFGWKQADYAF